MSDIEVGTAWSQMLGDRDAQQDYSRIVRWNNDQALVVLGDGMGGAPAGDVASRTAVDKFIDAYTQSTNEDVRERLLDGLDAANRSLFDAFSIDTKLRGMGTTLVAFHVKQDQLYWLSVGDSPLWIYRDGAIERINDNHSYWEVLKSKVSRGEISEEEAYSSPRRSRLTEAVMGEDIQLLDAPLSPRRLSSGDIVVVGSDGVETLTEAELAETIREYSKSMEQLVAAVMDRIVKTSRLKQDNATIGALRVK